MTGGHQTPGGCGAHETFGCGSAGAYHGGWTEGTREQRKTPHRFRAATVAFLRRKGSGSSRSVTDSGLCMPSGLLAISLPPLLFPHCPHLPKSHQGSYITERSHYQVRLHPQCTWCSFDCGQSHTLPALLSMGGTMKGDGAELRGGVWHASHLLLLRQDARANPLRWGEVILAHSIRGASLWFDPAASQDGCVGERRVEKGLGLQSPFEGHTAVSSLSPVRSPVLQIPPLINSTIRQ